MAHSPSSAMQFVIDKASRLKTGWNERPLSEVDFYRICKRLRVRVTEMPLRVGGFYYRLMGKDYIAVNSRLAGVEKLAVLFHELGHFLLHTPESGATANFHGVGRQTRLEREADTFALCALIPRPWLTSRTAEELVDDGFPAEMIAERYAIYENYGI